MGISLLVCSREQEPPRIQRLNRIKTVKELILDSSTLMVLGGIVALLFLVGLACICNFEGPESGE